MKKPRRILVARHGQSVENIIHYWISQGELGQVDPSLHDLPNREFSLTDLGRSQARMLRQCLQEVMETGSLLVSSHYQRAVETAEILYQDNPAFRTWERDPVFRERDYGQIAEIRRNPAKHGGLFSELKRSIEEVDFRPFETGETFLEVIERVQPAFAAIKERSATENVSIFLCCHGEIIRAIRTIEFGLNPSDYPKHFPDRIPNASADEYSWLDPISGEPSSTAWYRSIVPTISEPFGVWRTVG